MCTFTKPIIIHAQDKIIMIIVITDNIRPQRAMRFWKGCVPEDLKFLWKSLWWLCKHVIQYLSFNMIYMLTAYNTVPNTKVCIYSVYT